MFKGIQGSSRPPALRARPGVPGAPELGPRRRDAAGSSSPNPGQDASYDGAREGQRHSPASRSFETI